MDAAEYFRIAAAQEYHWWYRHVRALAARLLVSDVRPGIRALDAGCGAGGLGSWLAGFGQLVGVDVSADALETAAATGVRSDRARAGVEALPFAARTFDVILSVCVLYHEEVADPRAAVSEYARVLKAGGAALMLEPAHERLRRGYDDFQRTARRFRLGELVANAENAGLEVERATYANLTPLLPAWIKAARYRLGLGGPPISDLEQGGGIASRLAWLTSSFERIWLMQRDLPAGLSAVVVARKPRDSGGAGKRTDTGDAEQCGGPEARERRRT